MCTDNHNNINNYEEKDDHDNSYDDEDEDCGVWPQGCAADFLPALRIQIRCRAGRGPRRRKGPYISLEWNTQNAKTKTSLVQIQIHKLARKSNRTKSRKSTAEKEGQDTFLWNRILKM